MLLKRLGRRIPALHHAEPMQLCTMNRLHHQPSYGITTQICKRINSEITTMRKEEQFHHIVEQKRDWMSYLILQVLFKKNTTMVILRSFDRVLFHITTGTYCRFKRNAGLLPMSVKRSRRLHKANSPEMIDWVLKFFETQNIKYVHLQVSGWHTVRHEILRKIFDQLNVIQFADTTKLSFSNWGIRRRGAPHLKARFRPRGTIKIGKSRLTKPKE
eukprot:259861_1